MGITAKDYLVLQYLQAIDPIVAAGALIEKKENRDAIELFIKTIPIFNNDQYHHPPH